MNRATVKKLCALNTRFYATNAASFSQTRNAPWDGWRRCLDACDFALVGSDEAVAPGVASKGVLADSLPKNRSSRAISVLDIACGNLRFEAFLEREHPAIDWRFFAIDNCEPLVDSSDVAIAQKVNFTCEDIISNMLDGLPAVEPANTPAFARAFPFNLVVSFGFMHHIPGFDLRVRFLKEALSYTKPGGHLAVSFWQFLNDDARREKAQRTHAEALEFFSGELSEELLLHEVESSQDVDTLDSHEGRECHAPIRDKVASRERSADEDLAPHACAGETLPQQGIRDHLVLRPDDLEAGDYLLGWKNLPGQYRYCHHFSDEEIERIIAKLVPHANAIASFTADGKTGSLNRYVIFERC